MARRQIINTDVLLTLIDRFVFEKCEGDVKQLKIPLLGDFVRENGYEVQDYLIRRNQAARDHIMSLIKTDINEDIHRVASFRNMDFDSFFRKNRTKDKIIVGLNERDSYYRDIALSANRAYEEYEKEKNGNQTLKIKIDELSDQYFKAKDDLEQSVLEAQKLILENNKLREIVKKYVYPEIANELLRDQGLIKNTSAIVNPTILKQEIVTADKEADDIKTNIIRVLFDRFE